MQNKEKFNMVSISEVANSGGEINYSLLYSPLYPYCNIFSEKIKKKRKKELTEEGRCGNIINALEKRRKKSGSGAS